MSGHFGTTENIIKTLNENYLWLLQKIHHQQDWQYEIHSEQKNWRIICSFMTSRAKIISFISSHSEELQPHSTSGLHSSSSIDLKIIFSVCKMSEKMKKKKHHVSEAASKCFSIFARQLPWLISKRLLMNSLANLQNWQICRLFSSFIWFGLVKGKKKKKALKILNNFIKLLWFVQTKPKDHQFTTKLKENYK